jgi:aryl-alcohol dehydrogenase-like predicted oxidoreductase
VGKIIKGRRDRFVVGTKGAWLMEDDMQPNAFGLSRTYLSTQIEASLRRLDTDYIDLYQCHVQDPYTPVEETMRVLDDFVRAGKVRYVGVSNWGGWQVVKANMHARQFNVTPIVSNQVWYNLADRVAEFAIVPACRDQDVSIIAWGVLAQGILTGQYSRGDQGPAPGSGMVSSKPEESSSWERLAVERVWRTLDVLARIAECHGTSVPSVAMAWSLRSGSCDVALMGATSLEELDDSMGALDLRLSEEEMGELRQVSELPAPYPMNFWNTFCYRESEFYGGLR